MIFEHRETDGDWSSVSDADELSRKLFWLGGQGRITIDTDSDPYVMEGPEQ